MYGDYLHCANCCVVHITKGARVMSLEQYKDANRKELWEILQIQVERIAELEEMLLSRTKEVDNWILRYDRSGNKQREIIHGQKMRIAELEFTLRNANNIIEIMYMEQE